MTPRNELVSIIIPCYNGADVVEEAVKSALSQDYPNIEVIVVDDGSTDGSGRVLELFGSRIRVIHQENRGACAARNAGLMQALGQRIQFLDHDDLLYPTKVSHMLSASARADKLTIPVCDGLYELDRQNAEGTCKVLRVEPRAGEDMLSFCLRSPLQTPSPLHHTELLRNIGGFDETLPCSQERDLHLRLACAGAKLLRIPNVLYSARQRKGSLSASYRRVLVQHERIFLRVKAVLEAKNAWGPAVARDLAGAFARDARHLVRLGAIDEGAAYFRIANGISDGASINAFGNVLSRALARVIGPVLAEHAVSLFATVGTRP